jgi:hypothetical protein
MNDNPLNWPDCTLLNAKWKNPSLEIEWKNCISKDNEIYSNPQWKNLPTEEKKKKVNNMCCKEVMQCSGRNTWLNDKKRSWNKNNKIQKYNCPKDNILPPEPHFGMGIL